MKWEEWFANRLFVSQSWGPTPSINMDEEYRYQMYKARLMAEIGAQSDELLHHAELIELPKKEIKP